MKFDSFDPRRLALLARRDFLMNGKTLLVSGIAAVCAIVLISFLNAANSPSPAFHRGLYGVFLFFGGLISTSLMFVEAHRKDANHAWLMLPASTLEKFISRLLYSSVGYVAASIVVYFLASVVSEVLNSVIVGSRHPVFNPFTEIEFMVVLRYLVIQSVFIYGSVLFRKSHFIKTVVCIALALIAFGLLFAWFVNIRFDVFHGQFSLSFGFPADAFRLDLKSESQAGLKDFVETTKTVLGVLYWAVLAPLCWALAYLKLRKVQVNHGV